jgi:hypothetical protein
MSQRNLSGKGGALHAVDSVRAVEGRSAAVLNEGEGIEGQDGEAEAVSEGSLQNSWNSLLLSSRALASGWVPINV